MKAENSYISINELGLNRTDNLFKAALCCCFIKNKTDYENIIQHLNIQEHNYYKMLHFEKRCRSFLIGRFTAKKAVAALIGENKLTNVTIESGIFNQPIVVSNRQNIQISITHCDDFGAALAFPEAHPMGIDIERIRSDKQSVLERHITQFEKKT